MIVRAGVKKCRVMCVEVSKEESGRVSVIKERVEVGVGYVGVGSGVCGPEDDRSVVSVNGDSEDMWEGPVVC